MTRVENLKILKDLPYTIIWPESDWDDIGFTERELWFNSKGYGYFMCDEPNPTYWKGNGFDETLKRWINRLSNENDPALQNWAIRNKLNK